MIGEHELKGTSGCVIECEHDDFMGGKQRKTKQMNKKQRKTQQKDSK